MAQIQAVKCDACDHIDVPAKDAEYPAGWLAVDIHEEGVGTHEMRVYCSWACLADVSQHRANPPVKKRVRRTRAQIEADNAAKAGSLL